MLLNLLRRGSDGGEDGVAWLRSTSLAGRVGEADVEGLRQFRQQVERLDIIDGVALMQLIDLLRQSCGKQPQRYLTTPHSHQAAVRGRRPHGTDPQRLRTADHETHPPIPILSGVLERHRLIVIPALAAAYAHR